MHGAGMRLGFRQLCDTGVRFETRQDLEGFRQSVGRRHRRSIDENRDHADFSVERGLDFDAYPIAWIVNHPSEPVPADNQDNSFDFSRARHESVREADATPKVVVLPHDEPRTQKASQPIANLLRPSGVVRSEAYEDARRHANIPDLEYLTSASRQRKSRRRMLARGKA